MEVSYRVSTKTYQFSVQKGPNAVCFYLRGTNVGVLENNAASCFQRTFTGVGLRSVFLSDLYPDEDHSVQVRCGAQRNFWKWGDWSEAFSFRTNIASK